MAIAVMNWVLEEAPELPGHCFAVLMALASKANEDGTAARPGQKWLAEKARKTPRQVRSDLAKLEELGLIRRGDQSLVAHIPADERPVVWDLSMERKCTSAPSSFGEGAPEATGHAGGKGDVTERERKSASARQSTSGRKSASGGERKPASANKSRDKSNSPPTGERARAQAREYPTGPQTASPDGLSHIDDGDGFKLTDAMRRWVTATYPTLDADWETAQFIRHHRSMGSRRKSWPDAWQKWLGDSRQRQVRDQERAAARASPAVRRSTTDERVAQAQALKAKLRAVPSRTDDQPPHTIPGVVA